MPNLLKLLHGNSNTRKFLLDEFLAYWSTLPDRPKISRNCLDKRIREVAEWKVSEEVPTQGFRSCWKVPEHIQKQYLGEEKLELPNGWNYILPPKKKEVPAEVEKDDKEKKSLPLITQYAKKLSQEEMRQQLTPPSGPNPKKRVVLTTLTKSEPTPRSPRVSLIDKFVINGPKPVVNDNDDDIMIIEDDEKEKP